MTIDVAGDVIDTLPRTQGEDTLHVVKIPFETKDHEVEFVTGYGATAIQLPAIKKDVVAGVQSRDVLDGQTRDEYHNDSKKAAWKKKPKGRFNSMKEVFDWYFSDANVKVDRDLVKRIIYYVRAFETKNEEHIGFLGSNLIGVHRIRYADTIDEVKWIEEVLLLDDWEDLQVDYKDQEEINPAFAVTSNAVNASYLYLVHRIHNSPLTDKEKIVGITSLWKMLNLKFITSIIWRSWRYPAQEAIAMAVYESLSKKSSLKKYGTWGGLINHRADVLASPESIHYKSVNEFKDDEGLVYCISDVQTRIRKVVVKLNILYYDFAERDARVLLESSMITVEGERVIRESINNAKALGEQMTQVIRNPRALIKEALVEQTMRIVATAEERHFLSLMHFISENVDEKKDFDVRELSNTLVRFVVDYYAKNGKNGNTMIQLTATLRNLFRSSQLSNPDITLVKNEMERIVEKSPLRTKSKSITAPARVSALVYLSLRIITFGHYQ